MKNCSNLIFLSTIACQLAECLPEAELAKLSADLVVLSDMIANIIAHQVVSEDKYTHTLRPAILVHFRCRIRSIMIYYKIMGLFRLHIIIWRSAKC